MSVTPEGTDPRHDQGDGDDQCERGLPAERLRPVEGGKRDRPGSEKSDQQKAAQQHVPVQPSVSIQDRPTEPPQASGEEEDDGNTQADDREEEKDARVRIAAREQKRCDEKRAEHEHPTHNGSLRVGPRTP
jgi:hypothetical protein